MNFFLLQVQNAVDTLVNAATTQAVPKKEMHLIDLLMQAGWIMIPLLLLSVATVYVFVERWMAIKKATEVDDNFMNIIRDNILSGNVTAARNFARNTANPVGRIIDKGLQRIGKPIDSIENSMENVAQLEMYKLERNVNILSVISKVAPIFGFVGTLVGLMQLFFNINATGEYELSTIAGGIYTKLITSISGLVIGLIAYLFHNILSTQVEKAVNKMEASAADFLDVLQEPTR
ncbi:biopolymer transport protein ExbB [Lacibacter cauensis]|jgi:biopolymer transport protein ExbB|uniref:Biopolymer transport protein ExbB n=1 Tax=Lacibacter cauensis TaxID=510947 RepID=A0A562SGQ1_9BACT|nr:MotA/TolQ/ExbB proton channel family protein [Lacibacter cauensis]TWI80477.1 biopolymer transport protein ExbB [Lacibacter cauensis]